MECHQRRWLSCSSAKLRNKRTNFKSEYLSTIKSWTKPLCCSYRRPIRARIMVEAQLDPQFIHFSVSCQDYLQNLQLVLCPVNEVIMIAMLRLSR
jgi:hypothetical protein